MGIIAVQCEVAVTGDDLYHLDIIFKHWPVSHVPLCSFLIALVRHHVVLSLTQYSHSCSIHYHRIHPVYWKDRLQRVQAMGLNTIEVSMQLTQQAGIRCPSRTKCSERCKYLLDRAT